MTQAFSFGTAYGDISLTIDRRTGEVVSKRAAIVTTFGDAGPGLKPEPAVARLVAQAEAQVAPLMQRVIGEAAMPILRAEDEAGDSPLGHLIADAHRAATGTDFAFMNQGGIRMDLPSGPLTYHALFTVLPFGNTLIRLHLTGQQIYDLLNQQWVNQPQPRMLKVSGLTYTWDPQRPIGDRVLDVRREGAPIDRGALYSVTVNDYLAAGGDRFAAFTQGRRLGAGPLDVKALIAYVQALPQPIAVPIQRRITRVDEGRDWFHRHVPIEGPH
jgi:5'-nucleotidase